MNIKYPSGAELSKEEKSEPVTLLNSQSENWKVSSDIKNLTARIKNSAKWLNNRMGVAKEGISYWKPREGKSPQISNKQTKR